ncbi:MAG: hypothetical protein K9G11_04580 [Rickettsiaceae bacterium]|nr:hypothetical protein [Rickettsiaceae bacterium]
MKSASDFLLAMPLSALPLGDFAALCIYVEELFILDCHALKRARNDAIALPLEDVATFIIELPECLTSYRFVSSRA